MMFVDVAIERLKLAIEAERDMDKASPSYRNAKLNTDEAIREIDAAISEEINAMWDN